MPTLVAVGRLRIGTSGWSYPAWVGPFYPPATSPARMLGVYAGSFDTVEAHATYRRLPGAAALEKWAAAVPGDFRFAPKAHMGITHRRDLEGVEDRAWAGVAAARGLFRIVRNASTPPEAHRAAAMKTACRKPSES